MRHAEIIDLLGVNAVAERCGVHRTRVYAWKRERVPQDKIPSLLAFAKEQSVEAKAEDFLGIDPQPAEAS